MSRWLSGISGLALFASASASAEPATFASTTPRASYPGELAVSPSPEVRLDIGYTVRDRQLEEVNPDNIFLEGETVVAWTRISGLAQGHVEHVWYREGVEVARHDLAVGPGRRWRSWSRHRVLPGMYEVCVLAPDGHELARQVFDVASLADDDEHDELE